LRCGAAGALRAAVFYIGKAGLVRNKRAAARAQDVADLEPSSQGFRTYTETMPLQTRVPADIEHRLSTLGDRLAAACPDVEFAYAFGSVGTGRCTPGSDVDLAIHVSEGADPHLSRLEVGRIAANHLRTDAIDVVLLNTAPVALAGRVLTSRRVIVDLRPFARHEYESRTARLFQDFRLREHRLLAERYARG
jgi:predicted nucleotidyltransferase